MDAKMTPQRESVLRAFLEKPTEPRYGYELMKATKLASGTLYPLLTRLESEHMVTAEWETPNEERQRPRRYYKLTGEGVRTARLELAQHTLDNSPGSVGIARPAPGRST
ncbi:MULTISPECIES: helix-turn-helix transcriptional regulator [unclassified Streptomyces]|uniref:PadR family transcriptional regulator n=1 Tax=unclassified Streptomyces TaxID=2593676 RepID=UPI002DD99736|nr:helix-turn-helix transcriptional regulator [Streptomyces sp. NBC_01750]WSA97895.1 PadR family transcriptional regulator [Streptomyces sp. NBC_01794]WSD30581.1 PadR family transcriptional regulator [Streptomyces sp. NBC_01750]